MEEENLPPGRQLRPRICPHCRQQRSSCRCVSPALQAGQAARPSKNGAKQQVGRSRKAGKKVPNQRHKVALPTTRDIHAAGNAVTRSSSPSQSASGGSAVSLTASKIANDAPVEGMTFTESRTSVPQHPRASSSVEGTQTVEVTVSEPPRISVPLVSESILDPPLHHATGATSATTGTSVSKSISHVLPQSALSSGLRSVASRKQYCSQSGSLDESSCIREGENPSATYTRHVVGPSLSTLSTGSDTSDEQPSLPISSEVHTRKSQLSPGSALVSSSDVNSAVEKLDKMNVGVDSVSAVENLRTLCVIRDAVPRPKSTPTVERLATPSSSRSAFMFLRSSLRPRTLRLSLRSKLESGLDDSPKLGETWKRLHEQGGIQNEEEKAKTKKDLKNDENIQRQKETSVRESSQEKRAEVSSGRDSTMEIGSGPQEIRKGEGFTCPVCLMMCSSVMKLSQHVESHSSTSGSSLVTSGIVSTNPGGGNGKKKGSHVCHICSKAFVSVVKLSQHIEFHMSSSPKLEELEMLPVITGIRGGGGKRRSGHTCRVCSKVFVSPGRLSNHMYAAHPGLSGSSSSVGEMAAPGVSAVASVSGVKKKGNHVCPVCSKVFGSPGKLSQHMYSHTGERPFVCSECGKAFSSKFKLVRHALIHSSDSERRYRCNACDRSFHRKDHLQNHAKVGSEFIYNCMRISNLQNIIQHQCKYMHSVLLC